jgi:predicted Fe-Mo cluster-binding NifX family protein
MRIAIPVIDTNGLESRICDHFGSAPYFAIVDSDSGTVDFVINGNAEHVHGACNPIMVITSNQVDAIIVRGIGRNAVARLSAAGIRIHTSDAENTGGAIEDLAANRLGEFDPDSACAGHGT